MGLLDIRMRFLCLQYLNQHLLHLLPILNLLATHSTSLTVRLCNMSNLMFYDNKITFLHHVINASARRAVDQAPPEIKLDPLEVIGDHSTVKLPDSQFCQAAQQLSTIPSQQLCVRLASGGDPTYAFNVKMAGEEVHGTSKGKCYAITVHTHTVTRMHAHTQMHNDALIFNFRWIFSSILMADSERTSKSSATHTDGLSQQCGGH